MPRVCVDFDYDGDNGNGGPVQQVRTYTQTLGDGRATEFRVNHNLNSQDAFYSLRNLSTGALDAYDVSMESNDPNSTVLRFATAPPANSVRLLVLAPPAPRS